MPEQLKVLVIPNIGIGDNVWSLQIGYKIYRAFNCFQINYISWNNVLTYIIGGEKYIHDIFYMKWDYQKDSEHEIHLADLINEHDIVISLCQSEEVVSLIRACNKDSSKILTYKYPPHPLHKRIFLENVYMQISRLINEFLGLDRSYTPFVPPTIYKGCFDAASEWYQNGKNGKDKVFIAGGAGWPAKVLPVRLVERIYDYFEKSGYAPFIVLSHSMPEYSEKLLSLRKSNYLEQRIMSVLIAMLSRAAMVISADSCLGHIAALYGVPTITIFGASSPFFSPTGPRTAYIDLFNNRCEFQKKCKGVCLNNPAHETACYYDFKVEKIARIIDGFSGCE